MLDLTEGETLTALASETRSAPYTKLSRQQRRALVRRIDKSKTFNPHLQRIFKDADLTDLAFDKLTKKLTGYGNSLSDKHREALYCILGRFTHLATGYKSGRWGFDLPCGAGKTEAIKAWSWANWKLQKGYSLTVSASKVEALCALLQGMIEYGIPEAEIGLIHSYGNRPDEFLPPTEDNANRPILLLTHARVRGRKDTTAYNYRGQQRDLMIYDESLFVSDKWVLKLADIANATDALKNNIIFGSGGGDTARAALEYCQRCLGVLAKELEAQKASAPKLVQLERPDTEEIERYLASLGRYPHRLADLVDYSLAPLRVAKTNAGGAYIKSEVVVPRELKNVAVLDASMVIRKLSTIGDKVARDPAFDGNIKSYENVRVHQLHHNSGRAFMEKHFALARARRKISLEIYDVLRGIPDDQAVLMWSFKEKILPIPGKRRGANILRELKGDLSELGVDVDAVVTVCNPETGDMETKPRFVEATWGGETSTNEYGYCENVIMIGILHRNDHDLAAEIIGEQDDPLADLSDLYDIKKSEIAHSVYQAINRSAARFIVDGRAKPANIWLMHYDPELEDILRIAMPDVEWCEWEPRHLKGASAPKIKKVVKRIVAYLQALPPETLKISSRALKKEVEPDASERIWRDAVKSAAGTLEDWRQKGRSFERVT